jgi:thioester reductase-like protein
MPESLSPKVFQKRFDRMHVLLTGATGFLGQYLLRDLLQAGQPVAVLIRARQNQTPQQRLEQVLSFWEREIGKSLSRPALLEGDIREAGLGLSAPDRRWVARHCASVLHNAASVTFVGKDRGGEPWRSNCHGTAQVLEFCRTARLRELHYVSTAYVCGKRTDTVRENELERGQQFRNAYEESKFEAEKLLRSAAFVDPPTIYRPAVLIGDSQTGFTAMYHGIYLYMQFLASLVRVLPRDADGRIHCPVRLNLSGHERHNLVPVDWVAAVIAQIFRHKEKHGRCYQLTSPQPVLAREMYELFVRYFHIYGPRYVGPGGLDPEGMNDLEKRFYEYASRYEPYWTGEPVFDCSNTLAAAPDLPCPTLDEAMWRRLVHFAVRDRFGKARRRSAAKARPQALSSTGGKRCPSLPGARS